MTQFMFEVPHNETVGFWRIEDMNCSLHIYLHRRPPLGRRLLFRLLLGITWHDHHTIDGLCSPKEEP